LHERDDSQMERINENRDLDICFGGASPNSRWRLTLKERRASGPGRSRGE